MKDLAKQLGIKNRYDLPTCDVICRELGDRQLSYDDFENIDIATLESFCKGQDYCTFNISVDFDFENQFWVRRDGTPINDLKWTTSDFPRFEDILINQIDIHRNGVNWIGNSRHYRNLTGFYFCAGDQVISSNLYLGNYFEAKSKCGRILTLEMFNDQSLTDRLTNMITSNKVWENLTAVQDFKYFFKPLRFWTGTERLDQTRFVNENGTIITNPYCSIKAEELCDGCPADQKNFGIREDEKSLGIR